MMSTTLSYKKKNQLLLCLILIFIVISYKLAFRKTYEQYVSYKYYRAELIKAVEAPVRLAQLKAQLKELNNINKDSAVQEPLLNLVTEYCKINNVVLREFPQSILNKKNDYIIETSKFKIQGSFIKLLNLIYIIEQNTYIGKVSSVNFESKKEYNNKEILLTATIYVQSIRTDN